MTEGSDSGKAFREMVGIAIGRASVCWDELPHGIFDSNEASKLVDQIVERYDQLTQELAAVKERLSQKVHLENVCLASAYEEQLDEAQAEIRALRNVDVNQLKEVERMTNAAKRHCAVAAERLQIIAIYEKALKEYAPMEEWYESFADQNGSLGKIAQDALTEAATLKSQHKP